MKQKRPVITNSGDIEHLHHLRLWPSAGVSFRLGMGTKQLRLSLPTKPAARSSSTSCRMRRMAR